MGEAPGRESDQMAAITLTRADDRRTVELRTGEVVTVRLEENPTTGYQWALEPAGDEVLSLEGSEHVRTPGSAVGGGGERVFTLRAKKVGSAILRARLRRAWEPAVTAAFSVTFRATD
jgi:inhibitor of cysteine peptidase